VHARQPLARPRRGHADEPLVGLLDGHVEQAWEALEHDRLDLTKLDAHTAHLDLR